MDKGGENKDCTNKLSESFSPNINSSMFKNLQVEPSLENCHPLPPCSEPKRWVEEPQHSALDLSKSRDDNSLQCEEQSLENKSMIFTLNIDDKSHINENLSGKSFNTTSLETACGGNASISSEKQTLKHEYISSLTLSVYDKSYDCNNSGDNNFNNVHPDFASTNKYSEKFSPNLNLSVFKNLKVEESTENRYTLPPYSGPKMCVEEPNHTVSDISKYHDDNLLQSEEHNLANEPISSLILNMDDKNHINKHLRVKSFSTPNLETLSGGSSFTSSDFDINTNASVSKTLEAGNTPEDTSSSEESELSDSCETLSSTTSSSSCDISKHSFFNGISKIMDPILLPDNGTDCSADFRYGLGIDTIQDCVAYESVGSKQQSTNFRSLYKKRDRKTEKEKEQEKYLVELQKEYHDLKNRVSHLEIESEAYRRLVKKLNLNGGEQE